MAIDPFTGRFIPDSGFAGLPSNEGSRFGQQRAIWAKDSGTQGERTTFASQVFSLSLAGGIGALAWTQGGPIAASLLGAMDRQGGRLEHSPNRIVARLGASLKTGGAPASSSTGDFWYKFARRVENTGIGGPYLSGVFNLFARSAYLSEALSFYADRGPKDYVLDISRKNLGNRGRQATIDYLSKHLNMNALDLDSVNHLVWNQGSVFEGNTVINAAGDSVVQRGSRQLGRGKLVDNGKFWLGYASTVMPEVGQRNIDTGKALGQSMWGREGYALMPEQIGTEWANVLPGARAGSRVPNSMKLAQSYFAMASHRTAFLLDETGQELQQILGYLSPKLNSKSPAGFLKRTGLLPNFALDTMTGTMARYSGAAIKAFGALAILGQAGHWMRQDNIGEHVVGGALQMGVLAYAGHRVAGALRQNKRTGALIGAGAGALGLLGIGPFKGGPFAGLAGTVGAANVIRSTLGEVTLQNSWRRHLESKFEGMTDFTTAIGMGIAGGAIYTGVRRHMERDNIVTENARRIYLRGMDWTRIEDISNRTPISGAPDDLSRLNALHPNIRSAIDQEITDLITEYKDQGSGLSLLQNEIGKHGDNVAMRAESMASILTGRAWSTARRSIANRGGGVRNILTNLNDVVTRASFGKSWLYASVVGTALWAVGTGQLGTLETPGEVRALNSGEKLEEVKRGQKWELGGTPYEGTDSLYYRPTWIARAQSGAAQEGSTGGHGPLVEALLKNFTYKLERENYWDRPAPITSAAFDDVPFLYPLLKPLGDLIKRPRLMHEREWKRGDTYLERSTGLEDIPDPELGSIGMPAPYSPYSPARVWANAFDQMQTVFGLIGFQQSTALGVLTGSPGFARQREELESFSANTDPISKFYDLQSGGSFMGVPMMSEFVRRFLRKSSVSNYNPIENNLPNWMPEELRYGNPYTGTRYGEGEYRMPGTGYATLHPELKGTNPEDYPLLHRMNILGDVAPWSGEYEQTIARIDRQMKAGQYSEGQYRYFETYKQSIESKIRKRDYDENIYDGSNYEKFSDTIASVDPNTLSFTLKNRGGVYGLAGLKNDAQSLITQLNVNTQEAAATRVRNIETFSKMVGPGMGVNLAIPLSLNAAINDRGYIQAAVTTTGSNSSLNEAIADKGSFATEDQGFGRYAMASRFEHALGSAWEGVTHTIGKISAPAEYMGMFGFSPMQKFLPFRNAREEYEQSYLYGKDIRMWTKPLTDWFGSSVVSAAHNWFGMDFESPGISHQRETAEYFDKLKYAKYRQLASESEGQGDQEMASYYKNIARKTTIGSSGFYNEQRFKNVMGQAESRFALGFAQENNPEERARILEDLPEYKQRLMQGQWAYRDIKALGTMQQAQGLDPLATDRLNTLQRSQQNAGYTRSTTEDAAYKKNALRDESYADYRRREELNQFFRNHNVPRTDWIGMNPAVDLEDIKLKYIESEGRDYHDYSVYPSRANYIHRKPYITPDDVNMIGVQRNALWHARSAILEAQRSMQVPFSNLGYNILGPARTNNYAQITVDQYHSIMPSDFSV